LLVPEQRRLAVSGDGAFGGLEVVAGQNGRVQVHAVASGKSALASQANRATKNKMFSFNPVCSIASVMRQHQKN